MRRSGRRASRCRNPEVAWNRDSSLGLSNLLPTPGAPSLREPTVAGTAREVAWNGGSPADHDSAADQHHLRCCGVKASDREARHPQRLRQRSSKAFNPCIPHRNGKAPHPPEMQESQHSRDTPPSIRATTILERRGRRRWQPFPQSSGSFRGGKSGIFSSGSLGKPTFSKARMIASSCG